MYKLLLCWRYLKTRYLAMACIVSVMLGVATLIVVNSVMSGFSTKLRERLHGLLSDVVIEARGLEGFTNAEAKMAQIRADAFLGPRVEAMAPTLEIFAMLQFEYPNGDTYTRPVRLIGVDPKQRGAIGGFKEFLLNEENKTNPSFEPTADVKERYLQQEQRLFERRNKLMQGENGLPPVGPTPQDLKVPTGVILGNLIASYQKRNPGPDEERQQYVIYRGETVVLTTVGGAKMAPVYDRLVVVDYFKSEMSEYDANYVFVPLDYLQHLRTMPDRVTSIQMKLRDYADARKVVAALNEMFPQSNLQVLTWEDKQGPLLAAINIERGILNVLLFLIIAVAGFGILAIFSMIVTEKTRDIGILKALGASNGGVMKIFLGYGLLLGLVGAGMGTLLGVWLTTNINGVEKFLSSITGQDLFDRNVYYFDQIPTNLQGSMLLYVNLGSIGIAVIFSILPALRAAMLHPVRALRYE
jgi:lipoprotein-releasing system permease protein